MNVTEVLENAIQTLKTTGWCQGTNRNEAGQRCLLGAIGSSWDWKALECNSVPRQEAIALYDAAVAKARGVVGNSISEWNDRPERTVEEVIAALEAALEAAK